MKRKARTIFSANAQSHFVTTNDIPFFIFDRYRKAAAKRLTTFVDEHTTDIVVNTINPLDD